MIPENRGAPQPGKRSRKDGDDESHACASEELLRGVWRARGPTTSAAARGAALPPGPTSFPLSVPAIHPASSHPPLGLARVAGVRGGGRKEKERSGQWVGFSIDRKSNRWFFSNFTFFFSSNSSQFQEFQEFQNLPDPTRPITLNGDAFTGILRSTRDICACYIYVVCIYIYIYYYYIFITIFITIRKFRNS